MSARPPTLCGVKVTKCSYDAARLHGGNVCERLLSSERFEDNTHLADYSLAAVVDAFWPATDDWQVVAMEPAYYWPLWILEHPTRGVAAMMVGTTEPGGEGVGSPDRWEELAVFWRARNIHCSIGTHGPTRLAILQEMAQRMLSHGFNTSEESLVAALLDSPAFNDDESVQMMRGLGAFTALDERVQDARRRAREAAEKAAIVAAEKALVREA